MTARIAGVRIAGVAAAVPARRVTNDSFIERFGDGVDQVTKMTGVVARHVASADQTTADLCESAARGLMERMAIAPSDVDVVIFATQTPDYRLPATACALQHRLELPTGIAAFDLNLGCSAYPYALWLGATLIKAGGARRVLLLIGDTISKVVDEEDRATAMLFGDAGTATLIEPGSEEDEMTFVLGTDGAGAGNLIIPEGGFRASGEDPRYTAAADKLFMDGGEIFNFTLRAVPKLFADLLAAAEQPDAAAIDAVLFHQANAFMIKHLIKKAKIPEAKAPINIYQFGNTSSASIPLLLVTERREAAMAEAGLMTAMLGFGVGYSWSACLHRLRGATIAELIYA